MFLFCRLPQVLIVSWAQMIRARGRTRHTWGNQQELWVDSLTSGDLSKRTASHAPTHLRTHRGCYVLLIVWLREEAMGANDVLSCCACVCACVGGFFSGVSPHHLLPLWESWEWQCQVRLEIDPCELCKLRHGYHTDSPLTSPTVLFLTPVFPKCNINTQAYEDHCTIVSCIFAFPFHTSHKNGKLYIF